MAHYTSTSVRGSALPSSMTFLPIRELTATSTAPLGSLVTFAADQTTFADAQRYYDVLMIVLNCISILACIVIVVLYILLRRKNSRLMSRTSLKISVAMAYTDLLFHVSPYLSHHFCTHSLQFIFFRLRIWHAMANPLRGSPVHLSVDGFFHFLAYSPCFMHAQLR